MLTILCAVLLLGGLQMGACADFDGHALPVPLSHRVAVGDSYMGIRLLGSLRLAKQPVSGLTLQGLSGLAWDEDVGLLYALSDDGNLFHIRPLFSAGSLTDAQVVAGYPLQDSKGRPLQRPLADAEGMAIDLGSNGVPGDSQLIISFEGRPRIARYTPTGKWLRDEPLPPPLNDRNRYADSNKALEAVTVDKRWGLLTAPEWPLRDGPNGYVPIVAANRSWLYPLYNAPNSSLVAMEALPDGSLLTLERAFVSLLRPLVITLRLSHLPTSTREPLVVKDVAVFDNSQGWLLDNFEGLTRHRGQRFFMISDDNRSVLQSSLLVYFELLGSAGGFSE